MQLESTVDSSVNSPRQQKERFFVNPREQELVSSEHITLCQKLTSASEKDCKNDTVLCGFPSICSESAYVSCLTTPLKDCLQCSTTLAGILFGTLGVLGVLIICGNGLVIWNVLLKRKGFADTYSKIRGSLAFADLMTGIQVFAVVIPNLWWTLAISSQELDFQQQKLEGSAKAIVGGMFFMLGFTSSLYHLVFLSSQRLYAIALPFRYKLKSKLSLYLGLVLVWTLAVLSSLIPVWFPRKLTFTYNPNIFVYFPSKFSSMVTNSSYQEAIAILSLLVIFPYILMTFMSIGSVVLMLIYYKKRFTKLNGSQARATRSKKMSKHEFKVFKTVVLMEIGFMITILPIVVVSFLYYKGPLDCDNISAPHLISFLMSIANSLMNVIIYVVLDTKFRRSLVDVLKLCSPMKKYKNFKTRTSNILTSGQLSSQNTVNTITKTKLPEENSGKLSKNKTEIADGLSSTAFGQSSLKT